MSVFQEPPRRDVQIKFVGTAEEKQALHDAADRHGMSVAELIRQAVNEFVKNMDSKAKKRR